MQLAAAASTLAAFVDLSNFSQSHRMWSSYVLDQISSAVDR